MVSNEHCWPFRHFCCWQCSWEGQVLSFMIGQQRKIHGALECLFAQSGTFSNSELLKPLSKTAWYIWWIEQKSMKIYFKPTEINYKKCHPVLKTCNIIIPCEWAFMIWQRNQLLIIISIFTGLHVVFTIPLLCLTLLKCIVDCYLSPILVVVFAFCAYLI